MKPVILWFVMSCFAFTPVLAQVPSYAPSKVITMDEEPHHHLVLENDVVKVFKIELASHDAFLMHGHEHDDVLIVVGDATTVSTTPGQADILQMYKNGDVHFALSGRMHSVRNIGQTAFRAVSIDLLHTQTDARNICGKQIPDLPANCPAPTVDANAPRADVPQFETDQTRVTLTRIRPHRTATFGSSKSDELIVAIDESAIAGDPGAGISKAMLHPGGFVWIGHTEATRVINNDSDKEVRVVMIAFKP